LFITYNLLKSPGKLLVGAMLVSVSRILHHVPFLSVIPLRACSRLSEEGWHRRRFRSLEVTEMRQRNYEKLEKKLSENKKYSFPVNKTVVEYVLLGSNF